VIRRPRRVVPAVIVAVVLLAVMVLLVVACVQVLLGQAPVIAFGDLGAHGAALRWADLVVLVAGGVVAALGVVLLICAWSPGRPSVLPLAATSGGSSAGATRHSLRRAIEQAAGDVDGVSRASAKVGASRVRATIATPLRERTELSGLVEKAVGERLTDIALDRRPRITVRVNQTGRR
jgi:type IV secretory pathway TrbL component